MQTQEQLSLYLDRYRTRLKAKNLLYIKQILFVVNNFLKILGLKKLAPKNSAKDEDLSNVLLTFFNKMLSLIKISFLVAKATNCAETSEPTSSKLLEILDFLSETEILNLNLAKLVQYIETSKIALKLRGFSQRKFETKKLQVLDLSFFFFNRYFN